MVIVKRVAALCVVMASALLVGCSAPGGKAYESPEDAAVGLVTALRAHDKAAVREVLGPGSEEIIDSGDAVEDRTAGERFLAAYDAKHRFEMDEYEATLVVGNEEWPLPIPLIKSGNVWRFDAEAGKDELLSRRIGRNELAAIEVCRALVDAQQEYVAGGYDGGAYARRILSEPGTRNGLYWETAAGEAPSPMGTMVAIAEAQGYAADPSRAPETRAFHGYRYRLLTGQGPNAAGGAKSYEVDGKLRDGFAVVAYPADYGNSGIMTFLVNQSGVVFDKDLGEETERIAKAMTVFDPGEGWEVVE